MDVFGRFFEINQRLYDWSGEILITVFDREITKVWLLVSIVALVFLEVVALQPRRLITKIVLMIAFSVIMIPCGALLICIAGTGVVVFLMEVFTLLVSMPPPWKG